MTRLSVSALSKTYPGVTRPALNGLTLDIASGDLVAMLGPSGCGKTTAMKLVAGLLAPSSGDIRFDGRSVLADPPERRGAVMVFQNQLLFPHMSVAENIGFGLRMRKTPAPEVAASVARMLSLVQLPDLGRRRPSELSGGQQQRIALARALILRPKILLLDEPLSNLDAHLRVEMRDLIRDLHRETGITTVVVTHDQTEAVVLAHRVALLLDGTLRQYDQPQTFYKRPSDEAVARFFGGTNFVEGTASDGVFQSALGPLRLPDGARQGTGKLTFRPESIQIGTGPENTISVQVTERIYLGTQTRLRLQAGPVSIDALVSPDLAEGLAEATSIAITLPRSALWVLA